MNIRRQSGNFQFQEDPLSKGARGISKTYQEVLLLKNFLQTKPQVKKMNVNSYDLYYTVIKNREDNKIVNNKYEDKEFDYIYFSDFVTRNQHI